MNNEGKVAVRVRVIVLILAVVIGTGVGLALQEAHGADARPMCAVETGGCPTARVKTGADGARHYIRGDLGRAVTNVRYLPQIRRAITIKVQRWHNRQVTARAETWTRTEALAYWTRRDDCVSSANLRVGVSSHGWRMTCEGGAALMAWQRQQVAGDGFGPREVDLIVCGGLAGIGWKAGVAAGLGTGGWAWLTIGAGAAACLFQDDLRRLAD